MVWTKPNLSSEHNRILNVRQLLHVALDVGVVLGIRNKFVSITDKYEKPPQVKHVYLHWVNSLNRGTQMKGPPNGSKLAGDAAKLAAYN